MKFFTGAERNGPAEVLGLVRAFLAFAVLFVVALVAWRAATQGLSPAALREYWLGPPDFPDAAPGAAAVWEDVHLHAFFHGFLVLAVGAVAVRWDALAAARRGIVAAAAAAGLLDALAPIAIRWVDPAFAYVRAAAFPLLALAALAAALSGLAALRRAGTNGNGP